MRYSVVLFCLLFSVASVAAPFQGGDVEAIIDSMSLEKKVGQLFIFGFLGRDINSSLRKQLSTLYPGSIIVFGRNITSLKQIKKLNDEAQALAMKNTQMPLLIAVDQEGGKVLRIKTSPALPSARTLAMTKDLGLVQSAGFVTGQLLSALGFNMNLAPVVDISSSGQADFLGNRSFSHQEEIVKNMSVAFSRGLIASGILPTAKHFPGHGGVQTDSHLATPYKQIDFSDLFSKDLLPYRGLLHEDLPFAIMASHISYPLIDRTKLPATFSKILIDKVLREKMKFNGIVLTDDIQMKGAKLRNLSIGERAIKAIQAGNDVIMVGWNYRVQRKAVKAVIKAVKSGVISEARLNKSLRRIFKTKLNFYPDMEDSIPLKNQIQQIGFSETYDKIFDKVFSNQKEPFVDEQTPLEIYSFSHRFLTSFRSYNQTRKAKYKYLKNFKRWRRRRSDPTIVYHLSGPVSAKILRSAPSSMKSNIIVVNSSSKPTLVNEDQFKKVIHVYSYHPKLGYYTAKHLAQPTEMRGPADVGGLIEKSNFTFR